MGGVFREAPRGENGKQPPGKKAITGSLEEAKGTVPSLSPTDHQTDRVAQPPQGLAIQRRRRSARKPRAVASNLPSTTPQPRRHRSGAVSSRGHWKGLSCLRGNSHEQFCGEGTMATSSPYPTMGKGPDNWYLACSLPNYQQGTLAGYEVRE